MFFVYVVGCADGSLYTGFAADVRKRVREHFMRLPAAAKYTKSHPVKSLELVFALEEKSAALRLEARFKRLSHGQKLSVIEKPERLFELLPEAAQWKPKVLGLSLSECLEYKE